MNSLLFLLRQLDRTSQGYGDRSAAI